MGFFGNPLFAPHNCKTRVDLDPINYNEFVKAYKKEFKETTYDKLEKFKSQVNFASAVINYFKN